MRLGRFAAALMLAANKSPLQLILACAQGALVFLITSCASTTFYENGQKILSTQADMTNLTYKNRYVYFHADTMTHSIPTLAGGTVTQGDINALSGLASVIGASVTGIGPAKAAIAGVGVAASAVNNPPSKTTAIANAAVQPSVAYHRSHFRYKVHKHYPR